MKSKNKKDNRSSLCIYVRVYIYVEKEREATKYSFYDKSAALPDISIVSSH